jgi:hypothetical protein
VSVALFMTLSDLAGLALRNTVSQRVAVHPNDFTGLARERLLAYWLAESL